MTALPERDAMSKVIHDTIDKLPHAARLYPDIYSDKVADALLAAGFGGDR